MTLRQKYNYGTYGATAAALLFFVTGQPEWGRFFLLWLVICDAGSDILKELGK